MAGSLNRVQLIGNCGNDPEVRTLNNGNRVASFRMAMSESWKGKDGQKQEKTEWANVVCFNDGLVGVIEKYVEKGGKLFVEGSMQTRKYEKDGIDRYTTEVVIGQYGGQLILLGSKPEGRTGGGGGGDYSAPTGGFGGGHGPRERFPVGDLDDEIPFISAGFR